MGLECRCGKMGLGMRECGRIIGLMGRGSLFILMGIFMREIG